MPLSRLNDGFEIELEGIAFGMVDRQGNRWRCLITDRVKPWPLVSPPGMIARVSFQALRRRQVTGPVVSAPRRIP